MGRVSWSVSSREGSRRGGAVLYDAARARITGLTLHSGFSWKAQAFGSDVASWEPCSSQVPVHTALVTSCQWCSWVHGALAFSAGLTKKATVLSFSSGVRIASDTGVAGQCGKKLLVPCYPYWVLLQRKNNVQGRVLGLHICLFSVF